MSRQSNRPRPVKGDFYRHFKSGSIYKIAGLPLFAGEPLEGTALVLYARTAEPQVLYCRTVSDFMAEVETAEGWVERFTLIGSHD